MLVYVLFMCVSYSGCTTYEFKDKAQCENAIRNIQNHSEGYVKRLLYCQEVRK